jgi:hypothetical protein
VYDLSWDGQDYQQKAIYELQNGWNPVYTLWEPSERYDSQWLNHYPKAPWIAAASINQLSGNIESGKAINLLLIVALLFIAFAMLHSLGMYIWHALPLTILIAFNPVSVYQAFSYYVDGQVAASIALLLSLYILLIKRPSGLVFLTLIAALVVSLNIKFTGTVYVLLLSAGWLGLIYLCHHLDDRFWQTLWAILIGGVLGLILAGFQPFVTNSLRHGNPLYPTFGGGEFSHSRLLQMQIPDDFKDKGSLEKIFLSIFSPSMIEIHRSVRLKFPLSVSKEEIQSFWTPDTRVGGFGPWFGAGLILAAITAILLLSEGRELWIPTFLLSGMVVISGMVNPEAWWARYSAQLWLAPLVILAAALQGRRNFTHLVAYFLMAILAANNFMVSGYYAYCSLKNNTLAKDTFQELAERNESILVYYGPLQMVELKLQSWQIDYRVVDDLDELPCPQMLIPFVQYSLADCTQDTGQ